VQLASAIEQRMGVKITDDQMAKLETLGALRRAINQSQPAETTASAEAINQTPETMRQSYPHWPWSWPVRWLRVAFVEAIARPMVGALLAPRVTHQAEPPQGPMLLIANHVNTLDGALVLYALPATLRRKLAVAMSGEMLNNFRAGHEQGSTLRNTLAPLAYWLLTALFNVFPLPRLQGFRRSFAHAGEAMDRGYSILIFPEGTRSHGATMAAFRPGIGLLATQARVPVLPIALVGLGTLTSRHWLRTGRLEVRIGKVITMPETATPAEWTAKLETEMRRLLE
jgi:long-chain acyl-CoA synthetase